MKTVIKAQKGFTLIEVMIVVVILGVLAAIVVPNLAGSSDDTMVGATAHRMKVGFPAAIGRQFARTQNCATVTKNDLVDRGETPMTSWNENWTVSNATANVVEITFPLGASTDPADAGANLLTQLNTAMANGNTNLNSVAFNNPNLVVEYRCR